MARSLTLLAMLALPAVGLGQGKLDQVREAVDRPPPPSSPSARDNDCSSSDSYSDTSSATPDPPPWAYVGPGAGDHGGRGAEVLFLYFLAAPWMVPYALVDPGIEVNGRFASYPYARPDGASIVFGAEQKDGSRYLDRLDTRWWSVRASAEAGSSFDGLDRVGLRLFLDTDTRFGLKSDWDYYSEKQPCGCRDSLWIGDVTATVRFVQSEWLMMHTGVGARFLVDHGNDRAGVNFLYGFDAFPVQPVHLFGSFEAGTLRHADVYRLRGGVGFNWEHAELFAGYDFLRIGGVNLQGPMVGVRLWF